MKQLTDQQAKTFLESNIYAKWTNEQIVGLQLFQDNICVDMDTFFQAIDIVLGRKVFILELSNERDKLQEEFLSIIGDDAITELADYLKLIPIKLRIKLGLSKISKKK